LSDKLKERLHKLRRKREFAKARDEKCAARMTTTKSKKRPAPEYKEGISF